MVIEEQKDTLESKESSIEKQEENIQDATADDDSCIYPPPPAFEENFNDWQDQYSPSNYWWREDLLNAIKTDGPKGSGDGGIRLYRTNQKGNWPGTLYNRNDKQKCYNRCIH
mgnify:CR=1 FL=1